MIDRAEFAMREIMQVIGEQFGLDVVTDSDEVTAIIQKALDGQEREEKSNV